MQEASLEEGPVLRLILDYFERAGHAECLVPLENYCRRRWSNANENVLERSSFPPELAALREQSLQGKWDQVVEYLNAFSGCSDKEGLDRCLYLAERQKYFEILHHIENSIRSKFRLGYSLPGNGVVLSSKEIEGTKNLIQHQLSVLEGLSPSVEEFHSLKCLFCSSSFSSSKDFATWELHSGRLETFYRIGEWVSKVLYLTVTFPRKLRNERNLAEEDSCSLLRLIAKGLLYEQCEQLCRLRCGEGDVEDPSKLLDLSSWMQQQPDSSFQTFPSEIVLIVKPVLPRIESEQVQELREPCFSLDIGRERDHDSDTGDAQNAELIDVDTVAARIDGIDVANKSLQNITHEEVNLAESIVLDMDGQQPEDRDCDKNCDNKDRKKKRKQISAIVPSISSPDHGLLSGDSQPRLSPGKRRSSTPRNCKTSLASLQASLLSSPITSQPKSNATRAAVSTNSILNSTSKAKLPAMGSHTSHTSDTPQPKQTLNHKDPKIHEKMGLQTSKQGDQAPVDVSPHRSDGYKGWHQLPKTPPSTPLSSSRPRHASSVVKESRGAMMDFSARVLPTRPPAWPTSATLLGTLSDSQVVRSVAFSESGGIVAVGANSSTLRLCYTSQLLDPQRREPSELDVFYASPNYHKSSIYCLSWYHDSILASGSNDQYVRLLTCSRSNHKISHGKPLHLHNGTVRDIVFTSEGKLVSGGGGEAVVKVTDILHSKATVTLTGHTDQILAVGVLNSNLVMSGGQDCMMCMWDLRTQNTISKTLLDYPVTSLASFEGGVVAAHVSGSCSLFDLRSQQCTATYSAHKGECRTVRGCPSVSRRDLILSGSYDGTISLAKVGPAMVDATERVQWNQLCCHDDKVIQCRWHPQGTIFASTGADKMARFWQI